MNRTFPSSPSRLCRALACAPLTLALALPLAAQLTPQQDPANLAGERVSPQDLADTLPIDHGAPALQQLLRKLRTRASFMLIVAHPDDEDGGLLTYLSRGQGARVAMLTLNRGEGGQNLMSADFDDALGLIRTQELLAADRYMGVDQLFGTEVDFGFSKTKEEAFAKWTHERVLYDAVRSVRLYRPLVIASVFIGAPSDGHGQHQVSGEIAQEVFLAAGDPKVFPEMGLPPWQPLKVYARVPFARIDEHGMYDYATNQYVPARFTNYVTGKVTTTIPKPNVTVDEGTPDPLLGGLTYVQFARQGLALQKSQIGQNVRLAPPGHVEVSYHRYGSCVTPNSGCPIHRDSAMGGSSGASPTALPQAEPIPDFEGTESSLFEGIDTTLPGIATLAPEAADKFRPLLEKIDQQIAEAQRLFDPANPAAIAPSLADAEAQIERLLAEIETQKAAFQTQRFNHFNQSSAAIQEEEGREDVLHELRIKWDQLNRALTLALGLHFDATTSSRQGNLPSGAPLTVELTLRKDTDAPVTFFATDVTSSAGKELANSSDKDHPKGVPLLKASPIEQKLPLDGTATQGVTRPYFSRPDIEQPVYDISQPSLRDAPATPPALVAFASVKYQNQFVQLTSQVHNGPQPASFVPPVSVSLNRPTAILRPEEKSIQAVATVSADDPIQTLGGVKVLLTPDSKAKPELLETAFPEEYQKVIGEPEHIGISVDTKTLRGEAPIITAEVSLHGRDYSEGYRPVGYPGLTYTNYYTPATMRAVPVDVTTAPNLKVAYLPGTGDNVPAYLPDLGVTPSILTVADLTAANLKQYDAVILGVRAYTAHPELAGAGSQPLLNYASAGGVVILQYNNGHFGDAEAPYPISTPNSSGDHAHDVVDEAQPVTLLQPDAPLLTWPNRITAADFDHWVAERGHGFAGTWSPEYQALLETHDPGQPDQNGGLLYARVGKGAYIYLGLALYRQLPEGVPGAYRLLANLISAAKNPGL